MLELVCVHDEISPSHKQGFSLSINVEYKSSIWTVDKRGASPYLVPNTDEEGCRSYDFHWNGDNIVARDGCSVLEQYRKVQVGGKCDIKNNENIDRAWSQIWRTKTLLMKDTLLDSERGRGV